MDVPSVRLNSKRELVAARHIPEGAVVSYFSNGVDDPSSLRRGTCQARFAPHLLDGPRFAVQVASAQTTPDAVALKDERKLFGVPTLQTVSTPFVNIASSRVTDAFSFVVAPNKLRLDGGELRRKPLYTDEQKKLLPNLFAPSSEVSVDVLEWSEVKYNEERVLGVGHLALPPGDLPKDQQNCKLLVDPRVPSRLLLVTARAVLEEEPLVYSLVAPAGSISSGDVRLAVGADGARCVLAGRQFSSGNVVTSCDGELRIAPHKDVSDVPLQRANVYSDLDLSARAVDEYFDDLAPYLAIVSDDITRLLFLDGQPLVSDFRAMGDETKCWWHLRAGVGMLLRTSSVAESINVHINRMTLQVHALRAIAPDEELVLPIHAHFLTAPPAIEATIDEVDPLRLHLTQPNETSLELNLGDLVEVKTRSGKLLASAWQGGLLPARPTAAQLGDGKRLEWLAARRDASALVPYAQAAVWLHLIRPVSMPMQWIAARAWLRDAPHAEWLHFTDRCVRRAQPVHEPWLCAAPGELQRVFVCRRGEQPRFQDISHIHRTPPLLVARSCIDGAGLGLFTYIPRDLERLCYFAGREVKVSTTLPLRLALHHAAQDDAQMERIVANGLLLHDPSDDQKKAVLSSVRWIDPVRCVRAAGAPDDAGVKLMQTVFISPPSAPAPFIDPAYVASFANEPPPEKTENALVIKDGARLALRATTKLDAGDEIYTVYRSQRCDGTHRGSYPIGKLSPATLVPPMLTSNQQEFSISRIGSQLVVQLVTSGKTTPLKVLRSSGLIQTDQVLQIQPIFGRLTGRSFNPAATSALPPESVAPHALLAVPGSSPVQIVIENRRSLSAQVLQYDALGLGLLNQGNELLRS